MSSDNPADPRPDSQVEAEEANAAEETRVITQPEGGSRASEAASAADYERHGIIGAPGSETHEARAAAGAGMVVHTDEGTAAAGRGAATSETESSSG